MDKFKTRVIAAQNALKAPKNQRNNFGGYNYRSCEDILEAVKPICKANNLLLNLSDEVIMVGERYYIRASATLRDTESDESLTVTAMARESFDKKGMDDSQITGTASSYARKYALNGLFCVDDTKDADTDEYARQKMEEDYETPPKLRREPTKFICQSCGNVLTPYKDANGKEIGIRALANRSQEKFGEVLCMDCIAKKHPDSIKK